MYRALLMAQWKSIAPLALLLAFVAFGIPVWQLASVSVFAGGPGVQLAMPLLTSFAATSQIYPLFAYAAGAILGLATWWDDIQGKHVYALSLPVPRWYYLVLRMSTGLTVLAAIVAALWLSALLTVVQVVAPPGVHAYPGGLALRFALASALMFTFVFAIGAASPRALRIFIVSLGVLIVVSLIASSLEVWSPAEAIIGGLFRWPGLVDAFTGRWALFDV